MDCILLKRNYNIKKLINDINIAEKEHKYINPEVINEKSFSISNETHGWEAIPLHTINGIEGNKGTIPEDIKNKTFKPNNILLKCKYIKEILDSFNTDIYLVRLMKLKSGGYIAPHIDKLINDNKKIIRCQIPIITNDDIKFNIDKIDYNLEAGNLYYINVGEKIHYVDNKSEYDRITLVIDLNPDFIRYN